MRHRRRRHRGVTVRCPLSVNRTERRLELLCSVLGVIGYLDTVTCLKMDYSEVYEGDTVQNAVNCNCWYTLSMIFCVYVSLGIIAYPRYLNKIKPFGDTVHCKLSVKRAESRLELL